MFKCAPRSNRCHLITHFLGIKQCKCVEILRYVPYNGALFRVGNRMIPSKVLLSARLKHLFLVDQALFSGRVISSHFLKRLASLSPFLYYTSSGKPTSNIFWSHMLPFPSKDRPWCSGGSLTVEKKSSSVGSGGRVRWIHYWEG